MSITIGHNEISSQSLLPADPVHITYFNHTEGVYYQFLGNVKITNSDWKLINFLDLSYYTAKYLTLSLLYNTTSQSCSEIRQRIEDPENSHSCQQFAQATIPYLHEIDQTHQIILATLGNHEKDTNRERRGLGKAISRVANVLYGNIGNIDFGSIFSKITKLATSKFNDLNAIP